MPVARHETMKLWKHFYLSSTMAIDESSQRRKCDTVTQLLILLTSCTLSFLMSFIHSLPLPSKLSLALILPIFHPAPSFPTHFVSPMVLNQTWSPWLISQFLPIQFSFFSPFSPLCFQFPTGLSSKLLVTMLGDGGGGVCKTSWGTQKLSPAFAWGIWSCTRTTFGCSALKTKINEKDKNTAC